MQCDINLKIERHKIECFFFIQHIFFIIIIIYSLYLILII